MPLVIISSAKKLGLRANEFNGPFDTFITAVRKEHLSRHYAVCSSVDYYKPDSRLWEGGTDAHEPGRYEVSQFDSDFVNIL